MRRHRLRFRDEDDSRGLLYLATGAALGVAAGIFIAQRFGGVSAIASRVRSRFGRTADEELEDEDEIETEEESFEGSDELEDRVLEAFRNDPILSERAVDIGAIGTGIIELTGWVHSDEESQHAVTLTRGVPGVETVVNRLDLRERVEQLEESRRRLERGDDDLTEARWEGQRVGTGRRRQGTSAEFDRHADPKPNLEDRWLGEQQAIDNAAEDIDAITAERRRTPKRGAKGDRTGGAPVAPTGVPKGDHVADPESAQDSARAD